LKYILFPYIIILTYVRLINIMKDEIKRRNAVKTRQKILKVAEDLFSKKGFAGTSMRDIAKKADIRAATMYHYFTSKKAILIEIFEIFYNELEKVYERIYRTLPKQVDMRQGLVLFMGHHQQFLVERRNFSFLFFLEALRPGTPISQQLKDLTKKSTEKLYLIANRWKHSPKEKVLTLLMAVISINIFFSIADKYLSQTTGITLNKEEQMHILSLLIGSNSELEESL